MRYHVHHSHDDLLPSRRLPAVDLIRFPRNGCISVDEGFSLADRALLLHLKCQYPEMWLVIPTAGKANLYPDYDFAWRSIPRGVWPPELDPPCRANTRSGIDEFLWAVGVMTEDQPDHGATADERAAMRDIVRAAELLRDQLITKSKKEESQQ